MKIPSPVDNGCSPEGSESRHPSRPSARIPTQHKQRLVLRKEQQSPRTTTGGVRSSKGQMSDRSNGEIGPDAGGRLFTHRHSSIRRTHRPSPVITNALRGGSQLPVLTTLSPKRSAGATAHERMAKGDGAAARAATSSREQGHERGMSRQSTIQGDSLPMQKKQMVEQQNLATEDPSPESMEDEHGEHRITRLTEDQWTEHVNQTGQKEADLLAQHQMMSGAQQKIDSPRADETRLDSAGPISGQTIFSLRSSSSQPVAAAQVLNLEDELRACRDSEQGLSTTDGRGSDRSQADLPDCEDLPDETEHEQVEYDTSPEIDRAELSADMGLFIEELKSYQPRVDEYDSQRGTPAERCDSALSECEIMPDDTHDQDIGSWQINSEAREHESRSGNVQNSRAEIRHIQVNHPQIGHDTREPTSQAAMAHMQHDRDTRNDVEVPHTHPRVPSKAQRQAMLQHLIRQELASLHDLINQQITNTTLLQAHNHHLQSICDEQTAMAALYQAAQADLKLELYRREYASAVLRDDEKRATFALDMAYDALKTMRENAVLVEDICAMQSYSGEDGSSPEKWVGDCYVLAEYYAGVVAAWICGDLVPIFAFGAGCVGGRFVGGCCRGWTSNGGDT